MAPDMRVRLPLVALLGANAVSLLGNVFASIAIPWFVLTTTGSALQTGIAAVFSSAPLAIGAFFGGTVVDRIGAKRASVIGDLLSAISVGGIALLHLLGILEFWQLLVLAFAGSLFDAPAGSAREALVPGLAARGAVPLSRATSFITASEHGSYIIGAPLAGALIAVLGAPALLWIDAATFVASAIAVAIGVPSAVAADGAPTSSGSYLHQLRDGLRFLVADRVVRTVVLASTLGALLIDSLAPVVLPVYVNTRFGDPTLLGLAMAGYGIGGLLGIGAFGALVGRWHWRRLYLASWACYAASTYILVPIPTAPLLVLGLGIIGLTAGAIDPMERMLWQRRTPPELRGRVFALRLAANRSATPVSVFAAGALLEVVGLQATLLMYAVGSSVLAAGVILNPWLRD
jgi:MFS family permease